jgi:ABC-type uncharacterized transport system permease subunit
MMSVFPLTLALYSVAAALYLAHIAGGPTETLARVARAALLGAFISHAVEIGVLCVHGVHPFINARELLSFIAWLTVGAYLALGVRLKIPTLGALNVPVTIVHHVAARVAPAPTRGGSVTLIMQLHIGLAAAGVALFAVAAGDAVIYLAAETQLKRRHKGSLMRKGPSLETLDRINRSCILRGFPLFTIAMVFGALMLMRLPGGGSHRLLQPEYLMAVAAWGLYATNLVARVTAGWRGRRAALVTLAGFVAASGTLVFYYLHSLPGAVVA